MTFKGPFYPKAFYESKLFPIKVLRIMKLYYHFQTVLCNRTGDVKLLSDAVVTPAVRLSCNVHSTAQKSELLWTM